MPLGRLMEPILPACATIAPRQSPLEGQIGDISYRPDLVKKT